MKEINIKSSAGLWNSFMKMASLEDEYYDRELRRQICDQLGIKNDDVLTELKKKKISVEELLKAIFKSMEPFSRMLSDLLKMFEDASARLSDKNLKIEVNFDELENEFSFDLNHFREAERKTSVIRRNTEYVFCAKPWLMMQYITKHTGPFCSMDFQLRKDAAEWIEIYDSDVWPDFFPEAPGTGDEELDIILKKYWNYWEFVIGTYKREYKKELGKRKSHLMARELHEDDFWYPEIDRWSAAFLREMELLAELVRKKKFAKEKLVNIKKELKKDIDDFPLRSAWVEERADELREILSLPYWKKRYELYSTWISTQIIESLKDRSIEYHVVDGMLSFSFGGSLIATCRGLQPPLEIWTEKRTKAAELISEHRKSGIQPDYTLAIGSADTPENSIAVVECKQYKTSGNKNFREAIIDYANGRKNAEIMLVNYGPVSLDKLNIVDTDIKNRSSCVEYMKPDSRAITAFKEQLRKKVITYYQSHAQKDGRFQYPWTNPGSECSIKLSWKEIPSDLDLHLWIGGEENGNFHIYYAEMGQRKEIPYAVLDQDVKDGWGPEVIKIYQWLEGEYVIGVHNFSKETGAADSAAVEIECGRDKFRYSCPENLSCEYWEAARMNRHGIMIKK